MVVQFRPQHNTLKLNYLYKIFNLCFLISCDVVYHNNFLTQLSWPCRNIQTVFSCLGISIITIWSSWDHFIFIKGISYTGKIPYLDLGKSHLVMPISHTCTLNIREISQTAKFMGPTWGPVGPRWAPCWPHEPCYEGCGAVHGAVCHVLSYATWIPNVWLGTKMLVTCCNLIHVYVSGIT